MKEEIEKIIEIKTTTTPLLPSSSPQGSILVRTGAFGLNGLFLSAHLATSSKLLSLLEAEGAAAGSLVSTYQAVIVGSSIGILLSTGLEVGPLIVSKKYHLAGNVVKSAWVLTVGLGGISTLAMVSTRWVFPLLFDPKAAQLASDFYSGYSPVAIPLLMLITGPQVAFQAGDWFIPPAAMFLFTTLGGACGYVLGFNAGLGAKGLGLGYTISGTVVALGVNAWFLRDNYKEFHLYQWPLEGFTENIKKLLRKGVMLSLQRLTEWGNLMIVTTVIGANSKRGLQASNPGVAYILILATALQGMAQATGMLITKNIGARNEALERHNKQEGKEWHQKNYKILIQANILGMLVSGAIAGSFYFAREPLANFFLSKTAEEETRKLAQTLLCINMFGLIPDAVRIISAGALRGWEDFLYPIMVSLITMTIVGIPGGFGIGKIFGDVEEAMFFVRDVSMILAGVMIARRCFQKISTDAETMELEEGYTPIDEPKSYFSCSMTDCLPFSIFSRKKTAATLLAQEDEQNKHSYT